MRWLDVLHQDAALSRLDRALRNGRLAHAYLFAGPEGVGKRMTALRLAQRLLCASTTTGEPARAEPAASATPHAALRTPHSAASPSQMAALNTPHAARRTPHSEDPEPRTPNPPAVSPDACGLCGDCHAVQNGAHLDLHVVDRTMNRFHPDAAVRQRKAIDLSVDVIRHFVIEQVSHHPVRGRAKVFIIEQAERMTPAAQNALLKTLEEPPGTSYLILLTASADRLLSTTRSRCQSVAFAPLPDAFIHHRLTAGADLSDEDAAYLVGLADGRMGAALRYASAGVHTYRDRILDLVERVSDDPLAFSRAMQEVVKTLAAEGVVAAEAAGSEAAAVRATQHLILTMVACLWRDVLRTALGGPVAAYVAHSARLTALAGRYGPAGAGAAIRAVSAAAADLDRSAPVALVFDALGIRLARGAALRPGA